ncbi:MAG: TetR/AcrR family transcriptional regulator [Chloroflexota bacterium]
MANNRKQQIVDVAARLLAQKGFEGLRTREIAEIVGINHATIHYHFKDKETLIKAVIHSTIDQIYQTDMAAFEQTLPAREKLRLVMRSNLQQRQKHSQRFMVMGELAARANRDANIYQVLIDLDKDLFARMQALLDDGVASGDLRPSLNTQAMASMLVTLLRGVPLQPPQQTVDQFMQFYQQIEQDMLIAK